uniref:Uncharacterized protein n=1 Tax=Arundo donax TaxID=35708 RepID=A0A0A9FN47_ARUDO
MNFCIRQTAVSRSCPIAHFTIQSFGSFTDGKRACCSTSFTSSS